MADSPSINEIIDSIRGVVSGTRTGSAIDKYDLLRLWDLGDLLLKRGGPEVAGVPGATDAISAIRQCGIDAGPTLLKNAVRVRRFWPLREKFLRVASSLQSYGKLKDVIQIFDPSKKVPLPELEAFLNYAKNATYVETLERAKLIKNRFLRNSSEGLPDLDVLSEAVDAASRILRALITTGNRSAIASLTSELTAEKSKAFRLVLSAVQSPQVYLRFREDVRGAVLPSPEALAMLGYRDLGEVVRMLIPLRISNPAVFSKIVEEVGGTYLGDLANLLKALGSEEERLRYLKNQQVFQRFLAKTGA